MAELVARARAEAPPLEATRIVLRPRAVDDREFDVEREGDRFLVRGRKPARWVRQTDFSNDEAVGYLADRLARLGVEDALLAAGAQAGDEVVIGDGESAVVFDWEPTPAGRRRAAARPARDGPAARRPLTRHARRPQGRQRWPSRSPRSASITARPRRTDAGRRPRLDAPLVEGRPSRCRPAGLDLGSGRARRRARRRSGARSPRVLRPIAPRPADAAPAGPGDPAGRRERRPGDPGRRLPGCLRPHGLTVGQVLLTADDVVRRGHYRNAQRTLYRLLEMGVVPVVNENDTVATEEIRFGDNDRLPPWSPTSCAPTGSCCSPTWTPCTTEARPPTAPAADRCRDHGRPRPVTIGRPGVTGVGSGGMVTKVEAARDRRAAGIPTLLTRLADVRDALAGAMSAPCSPRRAAAAVTEAVARARHDGAGRLLLDEGAVAAVTVRRKSLLPAGITSSTGRSLPGTRSTSARPTATSSRGGW